jgi:hypothetical protein
MSKQSELFIYFLHIYMHSSTTMSIVFENFQIFHKYLISNFDQL